MQASLPEKDYTSRRGELSAYGRAVNSSQVLRRLLLSLGVLTSGLVCLVLFVSPVQAGGTRLILIFAIVAVLFGLFGIWTYTRQHFIDPDLAFRKWLQQVCDGELSARIELPPTHRHYKELNFHTKNLASSLRQLSTDMDNLVNTQTQRLENQNKVLELLFRLTSDIAAEIDLESVLGAVSTHLARWLDEAQVAVYLLDLTDDTNTLKLNATGIDNKIPFASERPLTDLPALSFSESGLISDLSPLSNKEGHQLRIPIFKLKQAVGMVEVIVHSDQNLADEESQRVFQTVSEQLSMFVERESAIEQAQHAVLMKERTQLGAEIHDSLAQTLLAARLQITMLRESMEKQSPLPLQNDVVLIEGMIEEANVEVRGLISEFRKPLNKHHYSDTIQKIIDEFNRTSQIEVYFQVDNPAIRFSAREDAVVERIVSEALTNAGKYSGASMIRVYLHDEPSGVRSVLIEDDGVGFNVEGQKLAEQKSTGSQIGLSIMRDRALSIGARLMIDSEPGEGTRVFLKLPPNLLPPEG